MSDRYEREKRVRKMRRQRFERRALLAGVGGIVAGSMLAPKSSAGDLEPPPGGVSPTGLTLSELSEKVARTPQGRAEARRPVESLPDASGTALYRITEPGSYVVTQNLHFSPGLDGIVVEADDVQIDLNGHTLFGPTMPDGTSSAAIRTTAAMVTVYDGTLQGWTHGVMFSGASRFVIEDVDSAGASVAAFTLGADGECFDCNAYAVAGTAFVLDGARTVVHECGAWECAVGFQCTGDNLEIYDCNVYAAQGAAFSFTGAHCDAHECGSWQCGTGFECTGTVGELYDCNVYSATETAFRLICSKFIVHECGAWHCVSGFICTGVQNLIVCNTASECSVPFDMGQGNTYGPWASVPGFGDLSASPETRHPLVNMIF
jgi:hypothetical protein